jgi:hypothetical protein
VDNSERSGTALVRYCHKAFFCRALIGPNAGKARERSQTPWICIGTIGPERRLWISGAAMPGCPDSDNERANRTPYSELQQCRAMVREPRSRPEGRHHVKLGDPCDCSRDLLRRARCRAGTDFGTKCRKSYPGKFDSRHFNYDQLHDVLQCSGGELSNRLLHSRAVSGHAGRNCDLKSDGGGLFEMSAAVTIQGHIWS